MKTELVDLTFYMKWTITTAKYPKQYEFPYLVLGLFGEFGEFANKLKKYIRDGSLDEEACKNELGDILWYLGRLYDTHNIVSMVAVYRLQDKNKKVSIEEEVMELISKFAENFFKFFSASTQERKALYLVIILDVVAKICQCFGWDLVEIAEKNKQKLEDRLERNKIGGSGDDR